MMSIGIRFLHADTTAVMMRGLNQVNDGDFVFCDENNRLYLKMHGDLIGVTPPERKNKINITGLSCKSCGAPLKPNFLHGSIVQCEYCGSVYDIDIWDQDPVENC